MPGALLLAGLFALFARKSRPGASDGWPLNAVQPLLFFYQMAQLLPAGTTEAHATLALLSGLFNMHSCRRAAPTAPRAPSPRSRRCRPSSCATP